MYVHSKKVKKNPPPSPLRNEKSPFTPQRMRKSSVGVWGGGGGGYCGGGRGGGGGLRPAGGRWWTFFLLFWNYIKLGYKNTLILTLLDLVNVAS
jgi:hypothetical protein